MNHRLLIVGAGLTGSLTATVLQRASLPITMTVWDKAKGAGGRMSTHRASDRPNLHVDMGAQYISKSKSEDKGLKEKLYEELVSSGVLVPFSGPIQGEREDLSKNVVEKYVGPKGLSGVVKHFLAQSKACVLYGHPLKEVNIEVGASSPAQTGGICCLSDDQVEKFDTIVFTIPVPQLLQLKGNILGNVSPDTLSSLSSVKYSSRYALGLFFKEQIATDWSARYFNDPVIRFAAWDTAKRECTSYGSSLLLHTSVPFGIKHLEDDKEEVKAMMLVRLGELVQGLPPPDHTHMIRWRYSQVSQVYPGSPGCLVLSHDPLVVATGDAFSGSNFENCIRAAQITAETVETHVQLGIK